MCTKLVSFLVYSEKDQRTENFLHTYALISTVLRSFQLEKIFIFIRQGIQYFSFHNFLASAQQNDYFFNLIITVSKRTPQADSKVRKLKFFPF